MAGWTNSISHRLAPATIRLPRKLNQPAPVQPWLRGVLHSQPSGRTPRAFFLPRCPPATDSSLSRPSHLWAPRGEEARPLGQPGAQQEEVLVEDGAHGLDLGRKRDRKTRAWPQKQTRRTCCGYIYIYIYIYIYLFEHVLCIYVYVYVCIYIYRYESTCVHDSVVGAPAIYCK